MLHFTPAAAALAPRAGPKTCNGATVNRPARQSIYGGSCVDVARPTPRTAPRTQHPRLAHPPPHRQTTRMDPQRTPPPIRRATDSRCDPRPAQGTHPRLATAQFGAVVPLSDVAAMPSRRRARRAVRPRRRPTQPTDVARPRLARLRRSLRTARRCRIRLAPLYRTHRPRSIQTC